VIGLPEKILAVHQGLEQAGLPHAFGGALALAWCTGQARGTINIDVNVFVAADRADAVLAALPDAVKRSSRHRSALRRESQVRLLWDQTPVDLFLNSTDFHEEVAQRVCRERFMGHALPFLGCHDLAVFKALSNRTRDWADLEDMDAAGTIDPAAVGAVLIRVLRADDERVPRLLALGSRRNSG
jgi:hypothetical protein